AHRQRDGGDAERDGGDLRRQPDRRPDGAEVAGVGQPRGGGEAAITLKPDHGGASGAGGITGGAPPGAGGWAGGETRPGGGGAAAGGWAGGGVIRRARPRRCPARSSPWAGSGGSSGRSWYGPSRRTSQIFHGTRFSLAKSSGGISYHGVGTGWRTFSVS